MGASNRRYIKVVDDTFPRDGSHDTGRVAFFKARGGCLTSEAGCYSKTKGYRQPTAISAEVWQTAEITADKSSYEMTAENSINQLGPPPDHRHANRRAPGQPRTRVTHANRGKQQYLYICTYNVRTLNNENLEIMLKELDEIKWSIIGLCETKIKDNDVTIVEGNHYLFNSGNNQYKKNGVGFLVNKSIYEQVIEFKPISDRISTLQIKQEKNKLNIIQCYFPTTDHDDEEIEALYETLEQLINNIPYRDDIVISGDFNAKVGQLHLSHMEAVGKYTKELGNQRGIMLANFCTRNSLLISNTLFKKRRLATWTSPNGKTKNQIDFIIIRKRNKKFIKDCSTISTPDISDHNLVRMKLKTKIPFQKKEIKPFYNLKLLKDSEVRTNYEIKLKNRFEPLNEMQNTDDILSLIEEAVHDTIPNVIPKHTSQKPKWMSENTEKVITEKKRIRKEKGTKSIEYKIIKSEVKKMVKKDKLKQIEDDCDELNKLPPNQKYYQIIKKIKNRNSRQFGWGIKRSDGTITMNKEEIIHEWETFYENLYHDDTNDDSNIDTMNEPCIPTFTLEEVKFAINQLKQGKAPGVDEIHAEMIKAGGTIIADALLKLFNRILSSNNVPKNFKRAEIILIFKKGDRKECKNYRPISLLNHTYKTFMLVIANRIKKDLYSYLPKSQAAYQPGRTTIEQIISLEQMIEKAIEFNKPIYAVFIDFTKAFDSIKLPSLWKALDKTPINKRYIMLLRNTYIGSKSKIRTEVGTSRYIDILKGVKQGDILSAVLFCVLLAAILNNIEEENGYKIGGHQISNLGYADDIVALDENIEKLQTFLNTFCAEAEKTGLRINISKTNAFTTDKQKPNITINGRNIEYVDNFVYLGHNINSKNNHQEAVESRINKGWIAINKNKLLLTSKRIPINIKVKIYKTYVLPVVLYGSECVTWNENLLNKMEIFHNKVMRMILRVKLTDRVTIKSMLETTKMDKLENEIRCRKIKLFGHLKRQESGLVKTCIEGMVPGKRKRGRPQRRWADDIKAWTKKTWCNINQLVKDRESWRRLGRSQSATSGGCG